MAVLEIGSWHSRCSACGENADPQETHHRMERMEGEGCGAEFKSMTPTTWWEGVNEACERLRPDLPLVLGFYSPSVGGD